MEKSIVLLIGNSDGIGLDTTKTLLKSNYQCIGVSRSESQISDGNYKHYVFDVTDQKFEDFLRELILKEPNIDVCIYLAGIGDQLSWSNLGFETSVFKVNLLGAVITTEILLDHFLKAGKSGIFIGVSSIADILTSPDSPSYSASKSGVTKFWEGLALANENKKVKICNVRFGFVDTKMAKSPFKPLMLSKRQAAQELIKLIKKPQIRLTKPKILTPLLWALSFVTWINLSFRK